MASRRDCFKTSPKPLPPKPHPQHDKLLLRYVNSFQFEGSPVQFRHIHATSGTHTGISSDTFVRQLVRTTSRVIKKMSPNTAACSATCQAMVKAVHVVQPLEQGIILNDAYSFDEYTKRRAHFLGNHSGYKHLSRELSQIAHNDGEAVFQSNVDPALVGVTKLSVQEVRRREIQFELAPLLPLPTTGNTKTIDNFASYGDIEWFQPSAQHRGHPLSASRLASASTDTAHQPNTYQSPYPQITMMSHQTDGADDNFVKIAPKPPLTQVNSIDPTQTAIGTTMSSGCQQTSPQDSTYTSSPTQMAPPSPFTMSTQESAHVNTPLSQPFTGAFSSPQWAGTGVQRHHDPALIKTIIDRLGSEPKYTMGSDGPVTRQRADSGIFPGLPASHPNGPSTGTSNSIQIRHPISALANRGFNLPVKFPRSKKRSPSPEDEETSIEETEALKSGPRLRERSMQTSSAAATKTLIVKLKIPSLGMTSPSNINDAVRKIRASNSTITKPSAPKPRLHGGLGKSKDAVNRFEYVIAGTALPSCPEEARNAAVERLKRLQRDNPTASKKSARRASAPTLDFPPEFFNNQDLPKDMEKGVVRCICKSKYPYKTISCEDCFAWQHLECMGSAVPEDLESGKYKCQVCDPWAHRELLARLRREQS